MAEKKISRDCVTPLFESKFIKVFDLQYAPGKHYYDATRRTADNIVAVKSTEEFKTMLPDAVTCVVIIKTDEGPKLLMSREYRYPTGQFLLSPSAGLIDPADREVSEPLLETARREIWEETGLEIGEKDRVFTVNPLLFSTPGMTDESNALVCAVIDASGECSGKLDKLTTDHCEGSEFFDGFRLLDKVQAKEILKNGRDENGIYYSVYAWCAMMYFVSEMWEEE